MSMAGYTKLFNSILASTIWEEDNETRIVWITLLAMADKFGVADGSVPGIASLARVKVTECRRALAKLQAPDADSRSDEYDGRRIKQIDGGWLILNHEKYRAKIDDDERREYLRIKKAESRKRKAEAAEVNTGQSPSTMSTQADQIRTEATQIRSAQTTDQDPSARKSTALVVVYSDEFIEFWNAYPKRVGKGDAWKAWQKARPSLPIVLEALAWQTRSDQWNRDGGQYRPNPSTYLNQRRWEDEPSLPVNPPQAERVLAKGGRNSQVFDEVHAVMEAQREARSGRCDTAEAGAEVAIDSPSGDRGQRDSRRVPDRSR